MIRNRKNQSRKKPSISTASLPDIIFMLLFFFMVVTVMRQNKMLLKVTLPKATEVNKIKNRSLVNYIFVGKPLDTNHPKAAAIQINDAFVSVDKIEEAMRQIKASRPEYLHPKLITTLKVDEEVEMGIVTDVKTALRKAEQLQINYEAIAQRED